MATKVVLVMLVMATVLRVLDMGRLLLLASSRGMARLGVMYSHQQTRQPMISPWLLRQVIQGVHQLAMPKVCPPSPEVMLASMIQFLCMVTTDSLLFQ